jgi:hypothetical protein
LSENTSEHYCEQLRESLLSEGHSLKKKEIDFRLFLFQDLTGSDQATQAENPSDERQNNKLTTASRNGPGSPR